MGAGESVMQTQHIRTMLVDHSTFRMLHMWTSGKFELQLHVFVACGNVNKCYGHQPLLLMCFERF